MARVFRATLVCCRQPAARARLVDSADVGGDGVDLAVYAELHPLSTADPSYCWHGHTNPMALIQLLCKMTVVVVMVIASRQLQDFRY